jgi:hypothetical protein
MVKVFLKHGRDELLRRFHPWVFSGAVAQVQGSPAEGDIVAVYSAEGQFLACGHWQVGSIAVRILSFDADPTAPDFWEVSIARALAVRQAVGLFPEGDKLSEPATASGSKSASADRPAPGLCGSKVEKGFMAVGGAGDMPPKRMVNGNTVDLPAPGGAVTTRREESASAAFTAPAISSIGRSGSFIPTKIGKKHGAGDSPVKPANDGKA